MNMLRRKESGPKHTKKPSATSAYTTPNTPLQNRTNSTKTTTSSGIGGASKLEFSQLPELQSTPPMPTFQKPAVDNRKSMSGDMLDDLTGGPVASKRQERPQRPVSTVQPLPPIADPGRLLAGAGTMVGPALIHRMEDTPPLPRGWTSQHDRAICILDTHMYSLEATVIKMRRTFPALKGMLTVAMVHKRLLQLDQDVYIDYFKAGLETLALRNQAQNENMGFVAEPTLRNTPSGNLIKSPSLVNMMPNGAGSTSQPRKAEKGKTKAR
ncbi:hypothetical protein EJ03DRAFT_352979 [Teratosphaeria nubilosa]|uniref:Uncharacterized protein n=1 Tax=Teratosphaeria nubilosa TaxID=161662 RepID=A0A6G1L471_9PEZI|nr:hypothetical protein EJ03DRAFT_352979 [Teratosphaeria nubilosa]